MEQLTSLVEPITSLFGTTSPKEDTRSSNETTASSKEDTTKPKEDTATSKEDTTTPKEDTTSSNETTASSTSTPDEKSQEDISPIETSSPSSTPEEDQDETKSKLKTKSISIDTSAVDDESKDSIISPSKSGLDIGLEEESPSISKKVLEFKEEDVQSELFEDTIDSSNFELPEKEKDELMEKYIKALDEYMKLKEKYTKKLNNMKKKIQSDETLSKKQKILKKRSLKPKCLKCKRNVGMIFKHEYRKYVALCGDQKQPCDFEIELIQPEVYRIEDLSTLLRNTIFDNMKSIIFMKLDHIFGFIETNVLEERFPEIIEKYETNSGYLEGLMNIKEDYTQHNMRNMRIKLLEKRLYSILEENKNLMNEFKKTNNETLLRNIVENYVSKIEHLTNTIQELKYSINVIEKKDNTVKVYRKEDMIRDLEFLSSQPKVVSFKG